MSLGMTPRTFDHTFKIAILGDTGVGKTALLERFADNGFSENSIATPGVNFFVKYLDMGDKYGRLNLWDTTGVERFRSTIPVHVQETHAILFVYSITDTQSFDNIPDWIKFASDHAPPNVVKILVGNKSDQENGRMIDVWQGKVLSRLEGVPFFETSAKNGNNVETTLRTAVAEILARPDLVEVADKTVAGLRRVDELEIETTDTVVKCGWCCNWKSS